MPVSVADVATVLRAAGCVYAEDEARMVIEVAAGDGDRLERLVSRRCAGEPLELVLGFVEFAGSRVSVRPGVFVPRQRTAGLVELAYEDVMSAGRSPVVVDLGCGCAAMLTVLVRRLEGAGREVEAYALDNDVAAVDCARANLAGTGAVALLSDYFAALPEHLRGRVDVVLANLPYVPTASMEHLPREARLYEPVNALDGGLDGLDPLRSALAAVGAWLAPGGSYLCELHLSQVAGARAIADRFGYRVVLIEDPDDDGALLRLTAPTSPEDPPSAWRELSDSE